MLGRGNSNKKPDSCGGKYVLKMVRQPHVYGCDYDYDCDYGYDYDYDYK